MKYSYYLASYRNYKLNILAALHDWEMTEAGIALETGSQGILLQIK
jgi:hypothetical protein